MADIGITGIGVDIVSIPRIEKTAGRSPAFLTRNFSEQELEYSSTHSSFYDHIAARFAAKEAVSKALGTVLRPADIEVDFDSRGVPIVILHGKTLEENPGIELFLSLSHEEDYAIAYCVAVK